ncbi:hypothetical protein B0H14DRAFT_2604157 [Mycena olivaceomarginata]|nr:hypothetical protein B0H14DRAFT_2604157 [Mycena olivaceomarginata]
MKSSSTDHWFETAAGKTHAVLPWQYARAGVFTRRMRNHTKDPSEPKKKRGNPGNFTGPGSHPAFVDEFMASFWKKFAWYEGRDAEGHPLPPSAMAQLELDKLLVLELKTDSLEDDSAGGLQPQATESVGSSSVTPQITETEGGKSTANASEGKADVSDPEGNDDPLWKKTGGVNPVLKVRFKLTLLRQFQLEGDPVNARMLQICCIYAADVAADRASHKSPTMLQICCKDLGHFLVWMI